MMKIWALAMAVVAQRETKNYKASKWAEKRDRETLKQPQYLENYSFDMAAHKLPIAYSTHGAAIQLHDKFVLLPDIKGRQGAIVMKKPIVSDLKFEIDLEFKLTTPPSQSHGMAMFLLDQPPTFPDEFHEIAGYRLDYKGLGVFLYRSEKQNKWVSDQNVFNGLVLDCEAEQRIEELRQDKRYGRHHQPEDLVRVRDRLECQAGHSCQNSHGLHLRLEEDVGERQLRELHRQPDP